jgi:hypothetical protein
VVESLYLNVVYSYWLLDIIGSLGSCFTEKVSNTLCSVSDLVVSFNLLRKLNDNYLHPLAGP